MRRGPASPWPTRHGQPTWRAGWARTAAPVRSQQHQPTSGKPGSERGFALVLVLWALLLLASLAAGLLVEARSTRAGAATGAALLQARFLADGAINRAIVALLDPGDPLRLPLDGSPHLIRLFGRDVTLAVQSEKGKVDLNAAPPGLLAALFRAHGVGGDAADQLAANVVAWRTYGPDATVADAVQPYLDAGRSYAPRLAPFRSVGELRLVLGMTDALQAAVAPAVTVWSGEAAVDRTVAGSDVLSVLEGAGDSLAGRQRDARNAGQAAGADRSVAPGEAVMVTARVETPVLTLERSAVVQVAGDRREPYRVLSWR